MQFLLLQELDASKGGGSAPSVVVSEAQTTNIEVIFNMCHFVNTYHFVNTCVSQLIC